MMKLGHIGISVSSLKRSISFYRKYFGLVCVDKFYIKSAGLTIILLKKGDICIELFEFKKHTRLPAYHRELDTDLRTLGVKHFSLEVSQIEKFYEQLKKSRVLFAADMRVFADGRRYFFIKDPDGILVEIMEARRRYGKNP
ncbi:MAG: VOC family protein [Candidatus Omnitrophota bacterium]|jgi:glyoxylase I family protein